VASGSSEAHWPHTDRGYVVDADLHRAAQIDRIGRNIPWATTWQSGGSDQSQTRTTAQSSAQSTQPWLLALRRALFGAITPGSSLTPPNHWPLGGRWARRRPRAGTVLSGSASEWLEGVLLTLRTLARSVVDRRHPPSNSHGGSFWQSPGHRCRAAPRPVGTPCPGTGRTPQIGAHLRNDTFMD
jgi:hypothetical protein